MIITARYCRDYAQTDGPNPGEILTTYRLHVTCTPADKRMEPLSIEVSSDRDLCELHQHVNSLVRDYVQEHRGRMPASVAEACSPPPSPYPVPEASVFGTGDVREARSGLGRNGHGRL